MTRSILNFFLMPLSGQTHFARGSFHICPKYRLDRFEDISMSHIKAGLLCCFGSNLELKSESRFLGGNTCIFPVRKRKCDLMHELLN